MPDASPVLAWQTGETEGMWVAVRDTHTYVILQETSDSGFRAYQHTGLTPVPVGPEQLSLADAQSCCEVWEREPGKWGRHPATRAARADASDFGRERRWNLELVRLEALDFAALSATKAQFAEAEAAFDFALITVPGDPP